MQEVTLRKTGSAEKLGLTVCYSSGSGSEDADTEVYISEIIPESLAARDGRLREGDQILRVILQISQSYGSSAFSSTRSTSIHAHTIHANSDVCGQQIVHITTSLHMNRAICQVTVISKRVFDFDLSMHDVSYTCPSYPIIP